VANLTDRFESVQKPTEDSRFLPSTLADRDTMVKAIGMVETDSNAVVIPIADIKSAQPKSASKLNSKKRRRDYANRNPTSEYMPEVPQTDAQTANFFPSDAG